jgi:transcription antitermination factor NusA-like protein
VVLSLKIGYLVPGVVVKSTAGYDAHLILISGTELLAFLPKKYAMRPYKVGENLVAAIFLLERNRIILSQRSPNFYQRVAERVFSPILEQGKIRVKRAVSVIGAGFMKMAVEGLNGADPVHACLPYLPEMKQYIDETVTLVRFAEDMKEYIRNALVPAPPDKIRKVIYSSSIREAIVTVDPHYYGLFVGKGGANVATAAKFLDIAIRIKRAEETEKEQGGEADG